MLAERATDVRVWTCSRTVGCMLLDIAVGRYCWRKLSFESSMPVPYPRCAIFLDGKTNWNAIGIWLAIGYQEVGEQNDPAVLSRHSERSKVGGHWAPIGL
jgi:hypothetical protein